MTKSELLAQFETLSGYTADGRWSVQRLAEKVEELTKAAAEKAAQKAAEEKEKQIANEIRKARIAARGSVNDFVELWSSSTASDDDRAFAYSLRRALHDIEREAKEIERFTEELRKSPTYALSWSKGLFELSGKAVVAHEMINWFEHGATFKEWLEHATDQAIGKARSPSMSTSPTSNLMDTYIAAAWADAAKGSRW
jgi:hypothetical protein